MTEASVRWHIQDHCLHLQGALTRKTVARLLNDIPQWKSVCSIDLSQVNDIDSAGLALLARGIVIACNGTPRWLNASPKIKSLSELYGLDRFVRLSI